MWGACRCVVLYKHTRELASGVVGDVLRRALAGGVAHEIMTALARTALSANLGGVDSNRAYASSTSSSHADGSIA